jgi:hypothetical protein
MDPPAPCDGSIDQIDEGNASVGTLHGAVNTLGIEQENGMPSNAAFIS